MNANEMADLMIQFDSGRIYEHSVEIATMLRQQQAEIEELKTCLIVEQEHNERMVEDRSKYEALAHTGGVEAGKELKELTNDEIKSEAKYLCHGWHSENPERLVLFARAILRKAQEK